ncbi:glutaredoxin family protein [Demequina iriomotensis]|uniref:glutaredoxin family protein n=1 Tax=Demequina iriomotensis TaxID=1536641 RepID=UPI0007806B53|nr:glutaredoxin family protein [Demequina iriomotensis]
MPSRVILYGRAGCHLCDDARAVVAAVCAEAGEGFDEVDIDSDPALRARYGDEIPVVTVDDATVGFWRIDPGRLRGALS